MELLYRKIRAFFGLKNGIKRCCKDLKNRTRMQGWDHEKCSKCGCRHFTLVAEKGIIGLKGASL